MGKWDEALSDIAYKKIACVQGQTSSVNERLCRER